MQRFTEWADSRRLTTLIAVVVAAAGFAAGLAAQETNERGKKPAAGVENIVAPENPAAVKGTWKIGAESRSITEGEFHDLHVLLTKIDGTTQRSVSTRSVWEHLLLVEEARGMGLAVAEGEVDAKLMVDEPEIHEGLMLRWKNQGVAVEDGRRIEREKLLIAKLQALQRSSTRLTTSDAFDQFKLEHLEYRLAYLSWSADDFKELVAQHDVDDLKLRTYWSDNPMLQNQFREQGRITAEFVFLDRDSVSLADARSLAGGNAEVGREEALDYFWSHRSELIRDFPAEKRHLLQIDENTELEDIVSPFSVLEESIKKKLIVERLLQKAFDEAKGGNADLEKLAEKYELGYQRLESATRGEAIQPLRRFGLDTYNVLNATQEGTISNEIREARNVSFFFRVNEKKAPNLPAFDEIKDEVRAAVLELDAYNIARDRAQKAMTDIEQAANAAVEADRIRIETQAAQEAETRALAKGLTSDRDIQRERSRAMGEARRQVEALKAEVRPKYFDEWVEKNDAVVHETDYFEFDMQRVDRAEIDDPEEQRASFFKTHFYVRRLNPGEVAGIRLDDPVTKSFFIVKMLDKRDPELSTMSSIDLARARNHVEVLTESRLSSHWQFNAVSQRLALETPNEGN